MDNASNHTSSPCWQGGANAARHGKSRNNRSSRPGSRSARDQAGAPIRQELSRSLGSEPRRRGAKARSKKQEAPAPERATTLRSAPGRDAELARLLRKFYQGKIKHVDYNAFTPDHEEQLIKLAGSGAAHHRARKDSAQEGLLQCSPYDGALGGKILQGAGLSDNADNAASCNAALDRLREPVGDDDKHHQHRHPCWNGRN